MKSSSKPPYKKYSSKTKATPCKSSGAPLAKTTYLVIVESPSKCKKIESFLGPEYTCIATKGHLRDIDGLRSIQTRAQFDITFSNIKEKQGHIRYMESIIRQYTPEYIYLATDDDREGEAIAWHVCQLFGLPVDSTPRIVFHEITKPAVTHAVQNLTRINMSLVYSQHARLVLDVLVGYKISPFLWKFINKTNAGTLSAGRCQTPALRLVYDRHISPGATSVSESATGCNGAGFYKTTAFFYSDYNSPFVLNHSFTTSESMEAFLEKSKTHIYEVSLKNSKENTYIPPKPFNTSRLLQTASNKMNLSPKQTMSFLQHLYQNGHITYMRTESQKYSKEFVKKAVAYIAQEWKNREYVGNTEKIVNGDNANPHEAIRVTHVETKSVFCKEFEKDGRYNTLYKLIWRNTLESCMAPAVYKCTPVHMTAPDDLYYVYNIEQPLFLGWHVVSKSSCGVSRFTGDDDGNGEGEDGPETMAPSSQTNKVFFFQTCVSPKTHNLIECVMHIPQQNKHYTEASLIQKLEELGIGRPSTFSMLVDTIQERDYVKKINIEGTRVVCKEFSLDHNNKIEIKNKEKIVGSEKNKLVLQPTGLIVVEFLMKYFGPLFSYEYTKNMELSLDNILSNTENPEETWWKVCKSCYNEIKELSKTLNAISRHPIKIDETYELVFNMTGPVLQTIQTPALHEVSLDEHENEANAPKKIYKTVVKDMLLDLDKLVNREYKAEELMELKNDCLGELDNIPVYIRIGKYGPYLEWGDKKESLKQLQTEIKDINLISLEMATNILKPPVENETEAIDVSEKDVRKPPPLPKHILRMINADMSVRRSKYGAYVYYKTPNMTQPKFLSLAKFKKGYLVCPLEELKSWIKSFHGVDV
jgi:DNA topoisomerase-1